MIKHVGKFNERDVVILFRKVPNEDHMCLVVYTDTLPAKYSTDLTKALHSEDGQAANSLADVLAQRVIADGRVLLNALHTEGFIKKAQTNGVIVTANEKSKIRLDELNTLIDQLEQGKEAAEKMYEYETVDAAPEVEEAVNVLSRDIDAEADPAVQAANMRELAEELLAKAAMLKEAADKLQPKSKPAPKAEPAEPVVTTETEEEKLNTISDAEEKSAPKRKTNTRRRAASKTTGE